MIGNLKELLKYADEEKFAIPAFNYSDIWEMEAIIEAAEEEHAPVIIATNAQVAAAHGIPYLGAQGIAAMKLAKVPVVNHLDHCFETDLCKLAIDSGYASVMIDKSHLDLEENIADSKEIVEYAKATNTCVEGEIGRIMGKSIEGTYEGDDFLVDVPSAVKIASEAGLDSLAIGIGNAHGFYKGVPKLNFTRLGEVNDATDIPLVLHGGTGIPCEDLQKAIKMGLNKINIGTQLHYRYVTALKEELKKNPDIINVINLMTPVKEAVKADVINGIRMCMANGKA